ILGLERFAKARLAQLPPTTVHWSPGRNGTATTHNGFDEDEATTQRVLRFIRSA
ncbi:MAG: hypothetical protein IPG91_24100, partial [Ideonella sp.]|nr:hypothetical protein [Ideonella sp.]